MMKSAAAMCALVLLGCTPNSTGGDAGVVDGGIDGGIDGSSDGGSDGGTDSGADGGTDGGDPGEDEPSCEIPPGGGVDDVELVQAWASFTSDMSHFICDQDEECVVVNMVDGDTDWCGCVSGGLTGKDGIAVNVASAGEAEAMTGRALSAACPDLQDLLQNGSCDGNPPIGAGCSEGRCVLEYDPCGWCGTNGCEDAGPG